MIFQQWVNAACDGKPATAARKIEASSGGAVAYGAVYRYYRNPRAMPVPLARAVVQASDGACSMEELIDADLIAEHFLFADVSHERERLNLKAQRWQRELQGLEARAKRLERIRANAQRQLQSLRARIERLERTNGKRKRRAAA